MATASLACLIAMDPYITGATVGGGRGANAGYTLGVQGDTIALNTGGKLLQLEPMALQCYAAGATDVNGVAAVATGQWETAPQPASTGGTLTFTLWGSAITWTASGLGSQGNNTPFVGKMPTTAAYIRFRLTSWTSGYFSAYIRLLG